MVRKELKEARFLTVKELAELCRVSPMTIYRLVHSGELKAARIGRSFRVAEAAVQQLIMKELA
jgi:excisionase family DNA binding protein